MNPIEKLQGKIFGGKSAAEATELTSILDLARDFGALGDILGREFKVYDKEGNLVYTIKQDSMKLSQLNNLIKEHIVLKKIDNENQQKMLGGSKGVSKVKGK